MNAEQKIAIITTHLVNKARKVRKNVCFKIVDAADIEAKYGLRSITYSELRAAAERAERKTKKRSFEASSGNDVQGDVLHVEITKGD